MSAPDPFKTDRDNPELSDADIAAMRPAREVLGAALVAAQVRGRGRPPLDQPKIAVKLRLDAEVVAHFKSGGPGWQSRINAALAKVARWG